MIDGEGVGGLSGCLLGAAGIFLCSGLIARDFLLKVARVIFSLWSDGKSRVIFRASSFLFFPLLITSLRVSSSQTLSCRYFLFFCMPLVLLLLPLLVFFASCLCRFRYTYLPPLPSSSSSSSDMPIFKRIEVRRKRRRFRSIHVLLLSLHLYIYLCGSIRLTYLSIDACSAVRVCFFLSLSLISLSLSLYVSTYLSLPLHGSVYSPSISISLSVCVCLAVCVSLPVPVCRSISLSRDFLFSSWGLDVEKGNFSSFTLQLFPACSLSAPLLMRGPALSSSISLSFFLLTDAR